MTTQQPAPATTLRLTADRSGARRLVADEEPTPASVWRAVSARPIADDLLMWPPDLFALTDVILDRSEAHRFAFSPPDGTSWPPERSPGWTEQVAAATRQWCAAVENETRPPKLLVDEWEIFRSRQGTPLTDLTHARLAPG
jgi:hypothetical protein